MYSPELRPRYARSGSTFIPFMFYALGSLRIGGCTTCLTSTPTGAELVPSWQAKFVSTRRFTGEPDLIDGDRDSGVTDFVELISSTLGMAAATDDKWPDRDSGGGEPARYGPACSTQDAKRVTPDAGGAGLTDLFQDGVGTEPKADAGGVGLTDLFQDGVCNEPKALKGELGLQSPFTMASTGRVSGGEMASEGTLLAWVIPLLVCRNPAKLPTSERDIGLQSTFTLASTGRVSDRRVANEGTLLAWVIPSLVFRNRACWPGELASVSSAPPGATGCSWHTGRPSASPCRRHNSSLTSASALSSLSCKSARSRCISMIIPMEEAT